MTTSEHREMVEEAQALMEGGRHPWPMLLKALEVGDRSVAEAVAEAGSSRFSAREMIGAAAAIKRTFPESPRGMERSPRRGARGVDPSDCGGAYQAKPEEYNQSEACSKALHRVECPPKDGVEYTNPDPAGRNVPLASLDSYAPQRRRFNKIRTLYNSDDAA